MPPAIKRRKLATPSKTPLTRGAISIFATISKATTIDKSIVEKNSSLEEGAFLPIEYVTNNKKRKLVDCEEDTVITTTHLNINPLPPKRSNKSQKSPRTPQRPIASVLAKSADTPTKGARDLLDRLFLSSKTPTRSPLSDVSFSSNLEASTPQKSSKEELPIELLDLINLHAAFLTALSIHYAHNGTHSPADLRMLCPDVARAWGKRRVLLEDIRRTLGVLNSSIEESNQDIRISRLSLSDYGHGKVCVEMKHRPGKIGRIARPLNENVLNELFVQGLKEDWGARESEDAKSLVGGLPLEPITICPSLIKMSPLLAKGQRRLEDMRAGITIKNEEKVSAPVPATGTRPTLLERLRAKQLESSNMPPPPSKAELARKAALGRIDEVVSVLTILSTSSSIGQSRVSFTMPTILSKLRDSFKTPMSKDEGDTCVRLLAAEIAPEWVRVVKMGKMEALVVNRDERPTEEDIRDRVERAV